MGGNGSNQSGTKSYIHVLRYDMGQIDKTAGHNHDVMSGVIIKVSK